MDSNILFAKDNQSQTIDSLLEQPLPLSVDRLNTKPASDRQISECQLWLSEHQVWKQEKFYLYFLKSLV